MAGLNFQTQTIINANVDHDSNNAVLFEGKDNTLRIKRDFVFAKDDHRGKVIAIRKRAGYDAVACKATVDFDQLKSELLGDEKKAYCRLDIYLGLEGAETFIYSTPWVQKGMPFWVEFTITESNQDAVAAHVADMIKKNNLFQVDKDLINVAVDGNKLILEGATEYQRFRKIEIHKFDAFADYSDKVAEANVKVESDDAAVAVNKIGYNSFGTYSQIVKDLRLPTAANYQWTHIRQAETPIVGATYNQYIIEYCAPASNDGLGAVGQVLESHTTHVFWVKNDESLISEWEAALAVLDLDMDVVASPVEATVDPTELGE